MTVSLTTNEFILRAPHGASWCVYPDGSVHLTMPRGQERAVYEEILTWLHTWCYPVVQQAEREATEAAKAEIAVALVTRPEVPKPTLPDTYPCTVSHEGMRCDRRGEHATHEIFRGGTWYPLFNENA